MPPQAGFALECGFSAAVIVEHLVSSNYLLWTAKERYCMQLRTWPKQPQLLDDFKTVSTLHQRRN